MAIHMQYKLSEEMRAMADQNFNILSDQLARIQGTQKEVATQQERQTRTLSRLKDSIDATLQELRRINHSGAKTNYNLSLPTKNPTWHGVAPRRVAPVED